MPAEMVLVLMQDGEKLVELRRIVARFGGSSSLRRGKVGVCGAEVAGEGRGVVGEHGAC